MSLIPFLLFAFVASITPGPTNILVLTNSQHFGVKNTVPAILGGCIAASAIVLVSGAGAGEVLRQYPLIRQIMSWAGVLWLSWMSWQLFRAPAARLSAENRIRFTARAAALLQIVNPKTWMMAGRRQPVCPNWRPCIAGYCANGAMVSADLDSLFDVLGVVG